MPTQKDLPPNILTFDPIDGLDFLFAWLLVLPKIVPVFTESFLFDWDLLLNKLFPVLTVGFGCYGLVDEKSPVGCYCLTNGRRPGFGCYPKSVDFGYYYFANEKSVYCGFYGFYIRLDFS